MVGIRGGARRVAYVRGEGGDPLTSLLWTSYHKRNPNPSQPNPTPTPLSLIANLWLWFPLRFRFRLTLLEGDSVLVFTITLFVGVVTYFCVV